jgi:hypothetical protein
MIQQVIDGLLLARGLGARTVEAEHDEVFFTLQHLPDPKETKDLEEWGWEPRDETNLWWGRIV